MVWDPVEGELLEAEGGPASLQDEYRSERGEIGYLEADVIAEIPKMRSEV